MYSFFDFLGSNYNNHFAEYHDGKVLTSEEFALISNWVAQAADSHFFKKRDSPFQRIAELPVQEGYRCLGCNAASTRFMNINHHDHCTNGDAVASKFQSLAPAKNFGVVISSAPTIGQTARNRWELVQEALKTCPKEPVVVNQFYVGEAWYTKDSFDVYSMELISKVNKAINQERVKIYKDFFKHTIKTAREATSDLRNLVLDDHGYTIRAIADGNDSYARLFGEFFAFLEVIFTLDETKDLLFAGEQLVIAKLIECSDPLQQFKSHFEDVWRLTATSPLPKTNREDLLKLFVRFRALTSMHSSSKFQLAPPCYVEQMAGKLFYFCRLYFLYSMMFYSKPSDHDKQCLIRKHLSMFNKEIDSPLGRLQSLKGRANRFVASDSTNARLTCFEDPSRIQLDGVLFTVGDLSLLVSSLTLKFDTLLNYLLLGIDTQELALSFTDIMANAVDNYGFANQNVVYTCFLSDAVDKSPALRRRFYQFPDRDDSIFRDDSFQDYHEKFQEAQEVLSSLIHVSAGMPGRGTEVCGLKLVNWFGKRNVFFLEGKIALHFSYSKTGPYKDANSDIFRFLPSSLVRRFILFVALVRPFYSTLLTQFADSLDEITASSVYLFSFRTGHISSDEYINIFVRHVYEILEKEINFSGWRQMIKFFSQQFFDSSLNSLTFSQLFGDFFEGESDRIQDLQAGHSTQTSRTSYGGTNCQVFNRAVDIRDYWRVSAAWHQLLGIEDEIKMSKARQQQYLLARKFPYGSRLEEEPSKKAKQICHSPSNNQISLCQSAELFQYILPKAGRTNFLSVEQRTACELATFTEADLIAVLPTGGGKTLIITLYVLKHGFALVIVPTTALSDQLFDEFEGLGLNPCVAFGKELNTARIVILTPDQATTNVGMAIISDLSKGRLRRVFLDEAHCVYLDSEFRDCFKKLSFLATLNVSLTFLSATMSLETEFCLKEQFSRGFVDQFAHVKLSSNCKNLLLRTYSSCDRNFLITLVRDFFVACKPEERAIIYVATRDLAIGLYNHFNSLTFAIGATGRDSNNLFEIFLGGMDDDERDLKVRKWKGGACPVMIATNAFGLGISYSAVRLVLNYGLPYSLDDFVQRIGRAGRDGQLSKAFLLHALENVNFEANKSMVEFSQNQSNCMRRILSSQMDKFTYDCAGTGSVLCGNCQSFKDSTHYQVDFPKDVEDVSQSSEPILSLTTPLPFARNEQPLPVSFHAPIPTAKEKYSPKRMIELIGLYRNICMLCAFKSKERRRHFNGCTKHKNTCIRCFQDHARCNFEFPRVKVPGRYAFFCCYGGDAFNHPKHTPGSRVNCNVGDVFKAFLSYTILRHQTEASIAEKEALITAELSSWKGEVCKIWSDFFDYATVEENKLKSPEGEFSNFD